MVTFIGIHPLLINTMSDNNPDIKDQVENFVDELEEASNTEEAQEKVENLVENLNILGFNKYSPANKIRIWLQAENREEIDTGSVKYLHGYQTWRSKFGRQVESGSDGFKIVAPLIKPACPVCGESKHYHNKGYVDCDNEPSDEWEEKQVGYRTENVFEYQQTKPITEADNIGMDEVEAEDVWEPDEITARGEADKINESVRNIINEDGIDLEESDRVGTVRAASTGGQIVLMEEQDTAGETRTLIHELAHEKLHWDDEDFPYQQQEIEAESVAYAVCQYYDIETDSEQYVAMWDKEDIDTWNRIQEIAKTSEEIIKDIEDKI